MELPCSVFKFLFHWITSCDHDTTIHLGWVQCPVGDANEGSSFLLVNNLGKREREGGGGGFFSLVILYLENISGMLFTISLHAFVFTLMQ